jgi:ribulose 1,5-bisphosphate synthetase/thiazole synthase
MRYLVRYWNGTQIINDLSTNDLSKAIVREFELRKEWGSDNVWMADAVQEILVG